MKKIKAITTCSVDLIQDRNGRYYVCEFNPGVQSRDSVTMWTSVIGHYRRLFPDALIDDFDKSRFDPDYITPVSTPNKNVLLPTAKGLIIFRAWLDAAEEFALQYRYRKFRPIVVDPMRMRAVYKDKAYAAALDDHNIFPKTLILTGNEIQNGALLEHFKSDEKIIIKCLRHDATIGTVIALAGDKDICLADNNPGYFFVVQPVIPTKGYTHHDEGGDTHYNVGERIYMTTILFNDGSRECRWWNQFPDIALVPSTSQRPEAILLNRLPEGFDIYIALAILLQVIVFWRLTMKNLWGL